MALRRAAHQLLDRPPLLDDPFAVPLLGPESREALARTPRQRPWSRALRAFAVARQRYSEDLLAAAVARGVRHYCLLGAGLDTFAWRNPYPGLRVWELDRAEMLAWKFELARQAGLGEPQGCVSIPIDFDSGGLERALAGLDQEPALFAMLGVAPYLGKPSLRAVLRFVQQKGPGHGIVLDYRLPRATLGWEEQRQHDSLAARVAEAGEPFRSAWTREDMQEELHGFGAVEDLGTEAINARYFTGRADGLATRGEAVRLVSAFV